MNATSLMSTTTAPTPSFSAARSMACWNFGAVWRSISPRTETTEYPSACSSMLTSKSVPVHPSLEPMQRGPWILTQSVGPVNRRHCTGMQCFLLIFGRDGKENHRAGGRLRRRGEPLPLDQELLQGRPGLRQAPLGGRRRAGSSSGPPSTSSRSRRPTRRRARPRRAPSSTTSTSSATRCAPSRSWCTRP